MIELKNIYRGHEIKFYNQLKKFQKKLLEDFITAHPEFFTDQAIKSMFTYQNPNGTNDVLYKSKKSESWKVAGIKVFGKINEARRDMYPTAYKLVESFGDQCYMATYSLIEPHTVIIRHSDAEFREGSTIRIHIPLYVMPGDVGFEVEGEVVGWDDIFAFNNQKLHGAWNNTDHRRLVFLLDLYRSACDLPPVQLWYPGMNNNIPPFEKTKGPNI